MVRDRKLKLKVIRDKKCPMEREEHDLIQEKPT